METLNDWSAGLFDVFALGAVQVAVLVLLVVLVQILFARFLSPRTRYALWLLVAVRLALPVLPEIPGGVVRWEWPESDTALQPAATIEPVAALPRALPVVAAVLQRSPAERPARTAADALDAGVAERRSSVLPPTFTAANAPVPVQKPVAAWKTWVMLLWFGVAAFLILRDVSREIAFRRRLSREPRVSDPRTLALLSECAEAAGMRRRIDAIETDLVSSPAVTGFRRPYLLLPAHVQRTLDEGELRHVFLHEIAHLKSADTALNALLSLLRSAWWFHPLAWLAISRLRAAQESARDWEALKNDPSSTPVPYAHTLIKLLESCPATAPSRHVIGMVHGGNDMKRRIVMITRFHRPGPVARFFGLGLVLALGWATFTSAARTDLQGRSRIQESRSAPALRQISVQRQQEKPAWRTAMERKLNVQVAVNFVETPASEVIAWLRANTKLNFIAADEYLMDYGDPEISLKMDAVRVSDLLDLIGTVVDDFGYSVTEHAVAYGERWSLPLSMDLRFYNVGSLLEDLTADEEDGEYLPDEIVTLTMEFAAGDSGMWERDGAMIEFWNDLVVITQTDEMHAKSHAFLNRLLNRGAEPPTVEPEWKVGLEQALVSRVDFSVDQEIGPALDALSAMAGVQILCENEDVLYEYAQLEVQDMPLRNVIEWIVRPHGLQVTLRNGAVVLSEYGDLQLEFYDIGEHLEAAGDAERRYELRDHIDNLLRSTISPESWDSDPRNAIVYYRDQLLVQQSPAVQVEVRNFLAALLRALRD